MPPRRLVGGIKFYTCTSVRPSVRTYVRTKTFVKLFSETVNGIDLKLGRIVWHDVLYVVRDFYDCRTSTSYLTGLCLL